MRRIGINGGVGNNALDTLDKRNKRSEALEKTTPRAGWIVGLALLLGAIGSLAAPAARANDVPTNITLNGGTSSFGALHFDDIDFTDTFSLVIDGAVSANVSLVTIGSGASNIDFLSADLNGFPLTLDPTGYFESGLLADTVLTGPLVLTVRGRSGATGGTSASYSGTINLTIIPEPSTAFLMGFGLLGLGLAARRAHA